MSAHVSPLTIAALVIVVAVASACGPASSPGTYPLRQVVEHVGCDLATGQVTSPVADRIANEACKAAAAEFGARADGGTDAAR